MEISNYYENQRFSNSTLSYIKRMGANIQMNPELLRLGSKIDEHLFDGDEGDEETAHILERVREDNDFRDIVQHPSGEAQSEWFGEFYDLQWKCKFDFLIKSFLVLEFKTCQVSNQEAFLQLINILDYDRQIYVYMSCANLKKGCILAVQKKRPFRVFKLYVTVGDDVWKSGKAKTEYLINILKSLL